MGVGIDYSPFLLLTFKSTAFHGSHAHSLQFTTKAKAAFRREIFSIIFTVRLNAMIESN
jgi:hypothetical protein